MTTESEMELISEIKEEKFMKNFIKGGNDTNLQEQKDEVSALQSFYEGGDTERLTVLSAPDDEGQGLFFLQTLISMQEQDSPITLDILVPADVSESEEPENARAVTPPLPACGVNFSRSNSGQKWIGSLKIDHLSPLTLQISLPPSYPSHDAPVFTLSSNWLSSVQLSALCRKLDSLWEENSNMIILFTWIDWLENNILSFLGIKDSILMMPFDDDENRDPRALPESDDFGHNIISILQFNERQIEFNFCSNDQDCDVCFDRLPGTHFFRVGKCGHHYCRACMTEYCEIHVKEGTVEELKCPDRECDITLPPYIIQSVLPSGAFERWERLMLQKTLTSMSDVVWCPRCNEPVIKEIEDDLNLAHCINCFYSFCTECNESWHQSKPCETDEDKLQQLEKKGGAQNAAAQKKFEELRKKIKDEIENRKILQSRTRKCPKCKILIEKIAGCNKMTCRCGQSFCWACCVAINGYDHYKTCSLMAPLNPGPLDRGTIRMPAEGALWIEVNLQLNPDARSKLIVCPMCKQNNLKNGTNNHMKCWNCKTNFCFLCKTRITGMITTHFNSASPCRQHS
ncbi:E3 ubiquitin-protein ligase RNF14 [Patella vulgata]|uniref:E3 ubiquitin-protein ligase RNF14 n=1 Tax=Patella vulgata TaxID=6465 RepID=UPI00218043AD|nr:E3 ubiquitin-protein ligase RNF14 [Patella vulgata]